MAERCVHAVVVAAGSGTRFGDGAPKQFALLAGRTVLEHAVGALVSSGVVDSIIVVTRKNLIERVRDLLGDTIDQVVGGGENRADSVRAGLSAIEGARDDKVLIHDAARPLLAPAQVTSVVKALDEADAVTLALPASDTLVEVDGNVAIDVPDRGRIHHAQTPQGFKLGILRAAHRAAAADAGFVATDDCGAVKRFVADVRIIVIPGSETNIKITTPADLASAEQLLAGG